MRVSRERLAAESEGTGFGPEILQKVIHLLSLLERVHDHSYLRISGSSSSNSFPRCVATL